MGKNNFAEVSKNLARYRSKIILWTIKIIITIEHSNKLCYQNFMQHRSSC